MAAYVIADVQITDPVTYTEYAKQVPATLAPYGGKFIVRGGQVQGLEGTWKPGRFVIIEFPSREHAQKWVDSAEYGPVKALRHKAAISNLILVEGVQEAGK